MSKGLGKAEVRHKEYVFQTSKTKDFYFISDTHFNHKNIMRFCDRPYTSLEDMEKQMIERWNSVVKKDELVFILGDIIFGGSEIYERILPQLNGRKWLILGNHDYINIKQGFKKYFEKILNKAFITIDGVPIILNHEPLLCFAGQDKNKRWQLFGHVHTTKYLKKSCDFSRLELLCTPTMYDVGADFNNYKPIGFKELKQIINAQVEHKMNFIEYHKFISSNSVKKMVVQLKIKLKRYIINKFILKIA